MNDPNRSTAHPSPVSNSGFTNLVVSDLPPLYAPFLELRQLRKTFGKGKKQLHVMENISLTVQEGEFVSIIGPSGSGKSTLLQMIGGVVLPDDGDIVLQGTRINGQKGRAGYMPQQPALFPWRTIEQNVVLARETAGLPQRESLQLARTWLDKVGLSEFRQAYPHTLSGGMQQRVAFLRALLGPQSLLCLDEPFSALDAFTRSEMQSWLLRIWEDNRRSVVFITHHIEEALLLSDTIYVLSNRPATVLERIEVPFERPRREQLVDTPSFIALRRRLTELLRAEVSER
ncbi:ABC transporter ATP-binding protein [Paenibacillus campi]|uniref:ABC transporter ATP-binding protein n=1 Tax=Paenibacillus campi TaxID=3106031 RepID=UPI002B0012E5|nr:ABC transporter ATP-binding protein [Paenibacillus sp. SGZ-1014]